MTTQLNDYLQEPITRRRFLFEQALIASIDSASLPILTYNSNAFIVQEAVAETALAHPEWNMDDIKTRGEWLLELDKER